MKIAMLQDDANIWFVTSLDAAKVSEITASPQVCVTMQNGRTQLAVTGTATIVHDRAKIRELWKDSWRVWFPDGKTDASIALIHLSVSEGEYWDISSLKPVKYLLTPGGSDTAAQQTDAKGNLRTDTRL